MNDNVWSWDAAEIGKKIRTRKISVREAVESNLKRLKDVNPNINAVVDILDEDALCTADRLDNSVLESQDVGPLHGVPITIKINIDYAGRPTTNGVVAFKDMIAPEDSITVESFRKAGAIIIGRTNVPAFSTRFFTDNALHGQTLNPWDPKKTPGGSSGGAAAAVASGIGALAHGNDRAGSVRYPAFACGVYGFRPTLGRVPNYNPSTRTERGLFSQITTVQGALARSINDLRLALDVLTINDIRDPWSVRSPKDAVKTTTNKSVALFTKNNSNGVHPTIFDGLRVAASWLEDAGYKVEEQEPPHIEEAAALFWSLMLTEELHIADKTSSSSSSGIEELGDPAVIKARNSTMANSKILNHEEFIQGFSRRTTILRDWLQFLDRHPIILAPVSWQPPFPRDFDQKGDGALGRLLKAHEPMTAVSLLGLPALSVPIGTKNGLPYGIQIIGDRFQEELLFTVGETIQTRSPVKTPIDPVKLNKS